jgi:hypothetical protein
MKPIQLTDDEALALLTSFLNAENAAPEPDEPCLCHIKAYIAGIRATTDHILSVLGE